MRAELTFKKLQLRNAVTGFVSGPPIHWLLITLLGKKGNQLEKLRISITEDAYDLGRMHTKKEFNDVYRAKDEAEVLEITERY